MTPEEFLRARGICLLCHQNTTCCVARALDNHEAHEIHWKAFAGFAAGRRPWWTAAELMRIIQRAEHEEVRFRVAYNRGVTIMSMQAVDLGLGVAG